MNPRSAPLGERPPLRIAHLADQYPLLTFTSAWREVQTLRADGVSVEPFSVWQPSKSLAGDEQSRTTYLAGHPVPALLGVHAALLVTSPVRYLRTLLLALRTGPRGLRGLLSRLSCFTWAGLLVRRAREKAVTHLHGRGTDTGATVTMLASTLSGIPYSFSVHGPRVFFMVKARHLDEKLRRALFVRCISHFCRSQCAMWTGPDTWPRLHVVHCGVDVKAYSPRIHAGPGSHVLFVGRPGLRKGLPWLVEALAQLCAERADLRITIVGDGPERPNVETLVQSAGISERVTFTGYQSAAQIAQWLTTADVFVLPSLAEGVPIVLMEAMAAGVPVVTTNVGGSSELVFDGVNGFLVPPVLPEALVRRIRQLLDDPGLRTRLGRAGRETVIRDFDLHRETARLRELFEAAHAQAFTDPLTDGAGDASPGPGTVQNGSTRWAPDTAS